MKKRIVETAAGGATGAGSIAAAPSRLGSGITRRDIKGGEHEWRSKEGRSEGGMASLSPEARHNLKKAKEKLRKKTLKGFIQDKISKTKRAFGISEAFDMSDVVSRLKGMERKDYSDNTITYGVEDDDGNMMKVTVRADQSKDFEARMSEELADLISANRNYVGGISRETSSTRNVSMAELLFNLRKEFDIVDVEFPTIPTDGIYNADKVSYNMPDTTALEPDAEGESELETSGTDDLSGEMDDGDLGDLGGEGEGDEGDLDDIEDDLSDDESVEDFEEPMPETPTGAEGMLKMVLDAFRAEAEAKKAQAEAEAEKARALQAEYTARAAKASAGQEEELLRIEAEMERQKEKEKEAKRIASAAKFKFSNATDLAESTRLQSISALLLEFDEYDTVQSLMRQRAIIRQKFRPEPTDDPETRRRKNLDMQDAMRELDVRLKRTRRKEGNEKRDAVANRVNPQDDQQQNDPRNRQAQPPAPAQPVRPGTGMR